MICNVSECPLISGKCDMVGRAELCACYRINQPSMARRLRENDMKRVRSARRKDENDPLPWTYMGRAKKATEGLPAFLARAHMESRKEAIELCRES